MIDKAAELLTKYKRENQQKDIKSILFGNTTADHSKSEKNLDKDEQKEEAEAILEKLVHLFGQNESEKLVEIQNIMPNDDSSIKKDFLTSQKSQNQNDENFSISDSVQVSTKNKKFRKVKTQSKF